MGFFDRFTSRKGKSDKAVPASPAKPVKADKVTAGAKTEAAKKKAFAAVPTGKPDQPKSDDKKKAAAPATTAPVSKDSTGDAYRILLRPVVTERSTSQQAQRRYTFEVAPQATKMDIRNAVQQVYSIRPVAVNILNLKGKVVRYGRFYGRTVNRRKAIITLPEGKTIDPFRN